MIFPFGQTITLRHRTPNGTDSYGDDAWTVTTTTAVGAFAPARSVETDSGTATTLQPAVYLPPGTGVDWLDAVIVDGVTYEVDGSPNVWTQPFTGWQPGVEVLLKTALRPGE